MLIIPCVVLQAGVLERTIGFLNTAQKTSFAYPIHLVSYSVRVILFTNTALRGMRSDTLRWHLLADTLAVAMRLRG